TSDIFNPTSTTEAKKTTAGNDIFYATTSNSLEAADIIDGGAGDDLMEAVLANVTLSPLVSNIENITATLNVKSDDDTTSGGNTSESTTLNVSKITGLNSLTVLAKDTTQETFNGANDAVGAATVTGLSSLDTGITIKDGTGAFVTGQTATSTLDLVYDYAATTGATDSVSLTVNNTATVDVIVKANTGTVATGDKEGVESIAIATAGKASTLGALASTKQDGSTGVLTSLTVTGDQNLTVKDAIAFATDSAKSVGATVTAGDFTGKLSATFDVADDDDVIDITSGSKDDTITVTSSGTDNTNGSAIVTITSGDGKDTIDVTDIQTRVDDATTTTVNETQITNITITSGDGNDTIKVDKGNVTIDAGAGDDTLTMTGIAAANLDKYDSIDLGDGEDTVATTDTTIDSNDKKQMGFITNKEVISVTGTNAAYTIDMTGVTGFTKAKVAASGTIAQATAADMSAAPTTGSAAVTFKSNNDNSYLIVTAAQTGQEGTDNTGTTSGDLGGIGGIGLDINAKLDNGNNQVTIVLEDNADISGGAGGDAPNNTGVVTGVGGVALDANEYEVVNLILSGKDTTKDVVSFAGGTAPASGGTNTKGADGGAVIVSTNATINITETLAAADSAGTALTDQFSSIDLGSITGNNVTVEASTLTGSVTIASVAGNTTINTGGGADNISAGTGIDTISLGAGDDTVDGQTGADIITLGTGNDVVTLAEGDSTTTAHKQLNEFTVLSGSWTGSAANDQATEFQSTNAAGTNVDADLLDLAGTPIVDANVAAGTASAAGTANVTYTVAKGIMTLAGSGASGVDTLAEWVTELDAAAGTADDVLGFEFDGSTYVFMQDTTNDTLVELVGVTGVTGLTKLANTGTIGGENYIAFV
ncbi:hypothetical protein N9K52_03100, partial [Litoricolaceae bacterium]|nr:hypothetical protein [Litorivicinaceae bacterium]